MVEDESLSESFWAVARQLRHRSMEGLAQWDIAPSHFRALGVLLRHGSMRPSQLADHLRIAARSSTEVIDALQQRGLVDRHPDPDDRRATLVALTPKGHEVGTAIKQARTAEGERFFAGLTATDRADLARVLRKLR